MQARLAGPLLRENKGEMTDDSRKDEKYGGRKLRHPCHV